MLPDINLLPKYQRQNLLSYILFLIGLILCLLLFVLVVYFYISTKSNLTEAEQNLEKLNQEKSLLEEKLASVNADRQNESIGEVVTFVENHIVPTSYLIDELIDVLPTNGYLSYFNYNYQTVDVETEYEKMSDAAAYIIELNKSEFIRDIVINQMYTLEQENSQEETDDTYYNEIPRYSVSYSIDVHQANLREVGDRDE